MYTKSQKGKSGSISLAHLFSLSIGLLQNLLQLRSVWVFGDSQTLVVGKLLVCEPDTGTQSDTHGYEQRRKFNWDTKARLLLL